MDTDSYNVGGFELSHLVVIFFILGCAIFVIYWLWNNNNSDDHDPHQQLFQQTSPSPLTSSRSSTPSARAGRVISRPEISSLSSSASASCPAESGRGGEIILYATEIEPGTVVLQSPQGDMFRVLTEYQSITQSGSPTFGMLPSPGTSYPVHYIPAYTRAHVQNQASAPPAYPEVSEEVSATAYDTWRPLCLRSGTEY